MFTKAVRIAVAALLTAGALSAQDLTLDQVLARHYEAIGGLDNWKDLQTMRATGRVTLMPGAEAPFALTVMRPFKVRAEFTFQGMTGVQAYDGTTAWWIMPFMGVTTPQSMPPEMSKDIIEQADIDGPLVGYEEEGNRIELVGRVEVGGTQAYQLKVTLKSGDVQNYFLDAEHFMPIRVDGSRTVQGAAVDYETVFADYKEVGGLMIAHSIEARPKGAPSGQVITFDTVELNLPVDESIFVMPQPGK
jgi:hypothetical protein